MPFRFTPYPYDDRVLRGRLKQMLPAGHDRKDKDVLKKIIGLIDLTTLEGSDTDEKVLRLCSKARDISDPSYNIPAVAAVCVYPVFVRMVKKQLKGSGIRTASVAGAFPSGQAPLSLKLEEVKYALGEGAEEIDMVMSRGRFLQGDKNYVYNEIARVKEACGPATLKVILETGELGTVSNVRKACEIALEAGADFIKTSTGKGQQGATLAAALIIADTIAEYYEATGLRKGIKVAGGISEASHAVDYYRLVEQVPGPEWLNPRHFRIGASRLADNILSEV